MREIKGKVFEIRGRFRGVTTIVIDVPIEKYTEHLAPKEEVEITSVKKEWKEKRVGHDGEMARLKSKHLNNCYTIYISITKEMLRQASISWNVRDES